MAKKLISINLDEDLIDEIDDVAKKVGLSRSAFVNLTMRGTVMGETSGALVGLLSGVKGSKRKRRKEGTQTVSA